MKNLITALRSESNNSFYLAFFRVAICLVLIKQVLQALPLIPFIYKEDSFLKFSPSIAEVINFDTQFLQDNIYLYMYIYLFSLILYLFGIGKNFTALVIFIMTDILQKLNPYLLNGGDNLLKFLLLYLVFANSFTYFSINKTKQKNNSYSNVLSNLSVLAICIHLCFIYFISALHKANATVWFHGIATYYIFQIERFSGTGFNSILANNSFFVVISTYFTLLLEMYYPVLVWFKRTKPVMLISMVCLHIGIAVFMMLYDFQLIFILVQGFFLKDSFWLPKYTAINNKIRQYKLLWLSKKNIE